MRLRVTRLEEAASRVHTHGGAEDASGRGVCNGGFFPEAGNDAFSGSPETVETLRALTYRVCPR